MRGTNTMTLNAETMRLAVEYWLNREVLRDGVKHTVAMIDAERPVTGNGIGAYAPHRFTLTIEPLPAPAPAEEPKP